MEKNTFIAENKKIFGTLFAILGVIALSAVVSIWISKMEEQACWDKLSQSAKQGARGLIERVHSDQELLSSIADIIKQQDSLDSPEVHQIIDTFRSSTMISHIALLLPGDKLMLPDEPVRGTDGILSFEEEAALGIHISDRSVDIRDKSSLILRNFVPIIKDGKTIAMLYGVVDLNTLSERWQNTAYDGQSVLHIMDGRTGEFIMDSWHKSLGDITEIGERKMKPGYRQEQLAEDVFAGRAGCSVFVSKTIGGYMYFYYEPIDINQWSIGISVAEDVAFDRLKKTNFLLIGFMIAETILLMVYFIWIWRSTKKEVHRVRKQAETDALVGILNRNSYEKNLHRYVKRCKNNLACVYADVNGLHELNNSKGHKAGDRMLQFVAHVMQNYFGDEDTYRIGGDEFVAFVKDSTLEDVQKKITGACAYFEKADYHVSIGICMQEQPIDIDYVVKTAEQHMYEEKERYYEQRGIKMRSRS